ncbi:HAMP domain-containing histidine kinase [Kribbella sandramycini]|uniref:histidine kinase n=1 Tax=Kribbella sandramycini TaxID=60450 RepID=A0A7Y4KX55_9ACTN|nr:HAMP domain-containing sensor histidine kinase [Kribbella sandramycini]MBB6568090.1 signal transduction histidine kinase [Kribbella sandramycini]NOL39316.1 HAMP domain-containing histidine kinase [Kribbella sandramycini]
MSLRARVTLTAIAVLLVVLPVTGLVVKAVFDAQAERSLDSLLSGRAQLAQQLARQNVAPGNLVRRVDADGVRVTLILRTGQQLGAPPVEAGATVRQVKATLQAGQRTRGATLLLSADTALVADASSRLRTVLLVSGAAAVLITALALAIGMRFALSPLDKMTALARSIATGGRGGRLHPARTTTELGRTAVAFDEMLDALEGAERTARRSEDRMREFVADAAHELRTPIAGLRTAAETLIHLGPQAPADRREELELLLVRESQRATRLVADLLELSRLDSGLNLQLAPLDLQALAAAEVTRSALLGTAVTTSAVPTSAGIVVGDAERIGQLLAGLVDNARQAGARTVQILVRPDGFLVADDGPGVPPEQRERIFERLVHGPHSKGAGLGLAIARGVARAHGGELTVGDRGDGRRGAVFTLKLPLVSPGETPGSTPGTGCA